jgi:tetratricopeptide (TPR) repeat protein
MRLRFVHLLAPLVFAAAGAAWAGQAEDPAAKVREIFGPAIREAQATAGQEDDVKLAEGLLAAAREGSRDASMTAALCQAVYELAAAVPQGLDVAVEALELLGQRAPDRAADCAQKLVAIRRQQYAGATAAQRPAAAERLIDALGDIAEGLARQGKYAEAIGYLRQGRLVAGSVGPDRQKQLQAEIGRLAALERVHGVIDGLKARLKSDPQDAQTRRRLIDLYLIELDDPAEAAGLLTPDVDEVLRTYVPLATKDTGALKPQACMELGHWYYSLRTKATTPLGRPAMLQRARGYLETYVQKADSGDLTVAKAKLTLERIEEELEALASAGTGGRWLDVLKLVDTGKHAVRGRWLRQGSRIGIAATGADRIVIPVAPNGDYELKVQFARSKGDGDVNVVLPVGRAGVVLTLSEHDTQASGLNAVNGRFHRDEKASPAAALSNRTVHNLHAKVTTKDDTARIRATLDGKKLLEWSGPLSALSAADDWRLPDATVLGLGTYSGCTTTFSIAQLRMLTGKAAPVSLTVRSEDDRRPGDRWREAVDRWRNPPGRPPGRDPGAPPRRR